MSIKCSPSESPDILDFSRSLLSTPHKGFKLTTSSLEYRRLHEANKAITPKDEKSS